MKSHERHVSILTFQDRNHAILVIVVGIKLFSRIFVYNRRRIMAGTETQIERIIVNPSCERNREDRSLAEISPRYRFATPRRVRQGANYEHASLRTVMRESSRQVLANVWRLDIKKGERTSAAKRKLEGAKRQLQERSKREYEKSEENLKKVQVEMAERMYELTFEIIVFTSGISGFSSHLATFKPELASISRRWRFTRTDAQKAGLSTPVPSTR